MSGEILVCALCQKPSSSRCGRCRGVAYCSKEHQKLDWKAHKAACANSENRRFEVAESKELGRHLIAATHISEGEVIIKEAPLITGPLQLTPPVCLGCYKAVNNLNSRDCRQCGWPLCSEACEKSSDHKPECEITRKFKKSKVTIKMMQDGLCHPSYQSITVLRCLYLKLSNASAWDKLCKLQSHCEERKFTEKYRNDLYMIGEFIPRFFNFQKFSEEEIMKVAGILQINAHHVTLKEPGYVAVYDKASLLEHNCQANCSKSFTDDGQIVIRTAREIKAGEHLSISYTEPLWGVQARRNHLLDTKFFVCQCPRCSDPTEFGTQFNSLKCIDETCQGFAVPLSSSNDFVWRCTTCEKASTSEELQSLFLEINEDMLGCDRKNPGECKKFLQKHEKNLHPNNHYLVEIKVAMIQCYDEDILLKASEEELIWLVNACRALNGLSSRLFPAENRLRGILYFQLHCVLSEIGRRKSLSGQMDDAEVKRNLVIYREILQKAYHFLKSEPEASPEGKMGMESLQLIQDLNEILEGKGSF